MDKLTYHINIEDESILDYSIPKFIIEPMVENAVVHGIETMTEEGWIRIDIIRKGDLYIVVEDNGRGFDVSKYLSENYETKEIGLDKREKIGIRNVDLRIKHIYGKKYGVTIQSRENEGTRIQINIPIISQEEADV